MISSVNSAASTTPLASILKAASSTSTSAVQTATGAGDSADISGPGKLFAALKELATENPEKFKEVTADIAAKLKAAASSDSTTSATGGSSRLADLAAKFEQASETGDVSVLEPSSDGTGGPSGYNRAGRPHHGPPPPPPPSDSSTGVDLKSLFDSVTKEVTDALAA